MKRNLSLLLLLAATMFTTTLHAQHFDWVKSYIGYPLNGNPWNEIVGSTIDSDGNLYVIGTFTAGAYIDSVEFLESSSMYIDMIIAKFSPQGDVLWHKVIHDPRSHTNCYGIRMVGDTSIVFLSNIRMPSTNRSLYFLDTLYPAGSYFFDQNLFSNQCATAVITLGKDGSLKDCHFLQLAFADSVGQVFCGPNNKLKDNFLANELLFDIDEQGNIYIARNAVDQITRGEETFTVQDGGISSLLLYVDGELKNTIYPEKRYNKWNHMIMKFSRDCDSLYWWKYLFDADTVSERSVMYINYLNSMDIDADGNIYFTYVNQGHRLTDTIKVFLNDNDSLYFQMLPGEWVQSCLIAFNSNFTPIYVKQLSYEDTVVTRSYEFLSTTIDEQSGSLFLLGKACRGAHLYTPRPEGAFLMDGRSLDLDENAYWFRFDKASGQFLSCGIAPTNGATDATNSNGTVTYLTLCNFVAHNNRVFSEVSYNQSISWFDTITLSNPAAKGMGLMVWDYDGTVIDYFDFGTESTRCINGPILLQDSVLYLAGTLTGDADLGEHHIYGSGAGRAFVAKYVDTAFIHPYVRPDLREPQSIIWEQDLNFSLADSPVTLTATSTSGLPVSYSSSDTSIARIDGSTLHLLSGGSCTILATCPDNDYYQAAAPVSKTLTVGQTGIADHEASPLLIYPNPSHGYMNLYGPTDQIRSITLYDMAGREVYHHTRTIFLNTTPADQVPCYSLNISHLPQGSYIVKVSTADGQAQHLKVVKK